MCVCLRICVCVCVSVSVSVCTILVQCLTKLSQVMLVGNIALTLIIKDLEFVLAHTHTHAHTHSHMHEHLTKVFFPSVLLLQLK